MTDVLIKPTAQAAAVPPAPVESDSEPEEPYQPALSVEEREALVREWLASTGRGR